MPPTRKLDIEEREIRERGLTSHMNDTKWRELAAAVKAELSFQPNFKRRYLVTGVDPWGGIWHREDLNFSTEWIKVYTRIEVRRGRLIPPGTTNCTEQFRSIVERLNVPYTEDDGVFTIYGHSKGVAFDNRTAGHVHRSGRSSV